MYIQLIKVSIDERALKKLKRPTRTSVTVQNMHYSFTITLLCSNKFFKICSIILTFDETHWYSFTIIGFLFY